LKIPGTIQATACSNKVYRYSYCEVFMRGVAA
jgi:hypothetical protein